MNIRLAPLAWAIVSAATALLVLAPRSSYQPGALLNAHQQLSTSCKACHRPWQGPSNAGCVNCHGDLNENNPHNGFDVTLEDVGLIPGRNLRVSPSHNLECLSCHTEHRGAAANVSTGSAFACTWCHKHPAIAGVSEHQVRVMRRQFFVRHLFKKRFNHYEHELLIGSHYPPVAGSSSCTFCHLVPPVQPGRHEQMSFKWTGCAGVGCHIVPQDSFMAMPESLGPSPTTISYSGVVPIRHMRAVFVHSAGHLESACERCHFKVSASRDPDDGASLAVIRCFDCHAHQLPALEKTAQGQSVAPQETGGAQLGSWPLASMLVSGRRPPPNLPPARGRNSAPNVEADICGSAASGHHWEGTVFFMPSGLDQALGPGRTLSRFSDQPLAPQWRGTPTPDQVGVRCGSSVQPRYQHKLRALESRGETVAATRNGSLGWRVNAAIAATPTEDGSKAWLVANDSPKVLACNQCHLFHAFGVLPTLDFPNRAPKFPSNQAPHFELTVYVPQWVRSERNKQSRPIVLGAIGLSPWWMGLVAIGFVAFRFTRSIRALPQKHVSHEAAPDVAPQRSKEVPALDDTYQTSVRQLYIVGEAAGTASINLAMRSGRQVIEAIASERRHSISQVQPDLYDVVIVGCGPAGLGATATARVLGLKYATLEKLTPASTLRSYPRAKFVQATPIDIAEYGSFFLEGDNSREELIREWEKIISKLGLVINDREEVVSVVRELDHLVVKTARGNSYPSRTVVLAIGVRGNPRHLNLPGEVAERVFYSLIDPDEFTGRKILVVGGGNAGAETVQALADARLGTTVSYSFRSPVLANITPENADAIVALQKAKKISVYPATTLAQIRPYSVVLSPVKLTGRQREPESVSAEPIEIENDFIFAMIGAELPTAFLRAIGVRMVSKGRLYG
jgi:thioredoxin reductase (NADPH)